MLLRFLTEILPYLFNYTIIELTTGVTIFYFVQVLLALQQKNRFSFI